MNELMIFENPEFGSVRTLEINGEPWFVGKDAAEILGYANTRDALAKHVDEEDRMDGVAIRDSIGREQTPVLINESGLYDLIFGSKLKSAKRFRHWVTSDILPSIRKHGAYVTDEVIENIFNDPDFGIRLLTSLKTEREARRTAESKLEAAEARLDSTKEELVSVKRQVGVLNGENDWLSQNVQKWADRSLINSLVRAYGHSIGDDFPAAWVDFKRELLYRHGINLNARVTAYLNRTGKKTRPKTLDMLDNSELSQALSTATSLCRSRGVDLTNILKTGSIACNVKLICIITSADNL